MSRNLLVPKIPKCRVVTLFKILRDAFARHFTITTVVFQNTGLRGLNGSCLAHDIPVQIKSSVKTYSTNYSRAA